MTDKTDTLDTLHTLPLRCRVRDVAAHYGVAKSTIYRWVGLGILPLPKKMGPNTSLWERDVILSAFANAPSAIIGKKTETS